MPMLPTLWARTVGLPDELELPDFVPVVPLLPHAESSTAPTAKPATIMVVLRTRPMDRLLPWGRRPRGRPLHRVYERAGRLGWRSHTFSMEPGDGRDETSGARRVHGKAGLVQT